MAGKPEIIACSKLPDFVPEERIRQLGLYNQPEFLDLVAPGKSFLARIKNSRGEDAWFPFTGQDWLLKWRIFQVPYCQRFQPFTETGSPDAEHWNIWLSFLANQTFQCHWPFDASSISDDVQNPKFHPKTNQYFSLKSSVEEILKRWKPGRKSALRKSEHLSVVSLSATKFKTALQSMIKAGQFKGWVPDEKEAKSILSISDSVFFENNLHRMAVQDESGTRSLALLLFWNGRYHYLFSVTSARGFETDSLTRFFHEFILRHAGEDAVFDFEGSGIPGVHTFFKSLGAEEESYFVYRK
ncbi:MAG TPA: hypothetical protein PK509_06615 [Catalimonadaceae bacterium]|nr:hypothetical protein [Catalimonadaceae bacterium]